MTESNEVNKFPVTEHKPTYHTGNVFGSGMKPKVRARAAELNAEPELFQFKANMTYLIKSKAQKYHILRNQHKILRKIMTYGKLTPFVYYFDRFSNLHFEEQLLSFA